MALDQLLEANREEILRIAAKHGAKNVRVFGSYANGEATLKSEVAFLVDVAAEHSPWFPGGLLMDLQDLLGRKVHIFEPEGLRLDIRDQVLKEAVSL